MSNHLKAGWNFLSRRLGQFIDEVPAQMQMGDQWYKGTADAIRQNMSLIERADAERVLVLAGDHIYKMDYRQMERFHKERDACVTVGAVRVEAEVARGNYGVLQVDDNGRIIGFEEKPAEPKTISGTSQCYASMGVYMFESDCLPECLRHHRDDFGRDIIPSMVQANRPAYAYDFNTLNNVEEYEYVTRDGQRTRELVKRASDSDYWRDIGTVDQFWLANLDLVSPRPRFNLYGEKWPLFNSPQHFPPAKFVHEVEGRVGTAVNSIVADGVIISGAQVRNSVLSAGSYIHSYSLIENSVMFGGSIQGGSRIETSIGRNCRIRNAIIDKNVLLSASTVIGYNRTDDEKRGLLTHPITGTDDYIVVVPKWFTL
jgi:glucose-1-phosphate adenylyltransferase